jgi:hypothetical protein
MEGEMAPTTRARFLAAWWVLFSTLWHFALTPSHGPLFFLNDVQKDLVCLTSRKIPRSQKHAKQENLVRSVKTK